ncbi:unnamed protein product [Malus baccata var. baccata]
MGIRIYIGFVKMGIILERNTYLALVGALIRSKSFLKVVEIAAEMIRAGCSLGIYLSALLIHRLGRARRTHCAAKIFNLLLYDHKCTATYTALNGASLLGVLIKGFKYLKRCEGNDFVPFWAHTIRVHEAEMFRKEKKSMQADGEF